jgi:L-malate glycosyltransferase
MAILLVDTSKEFRGGQQQLCHLVKGLRDIGEQIFVALRSGSPLEAKISALGAQTLNISPLFEGDPIAARALGKSIDRFKIDLVNAQASHDHTLVWSAIAFSSRKPVRVVTRRVDFTPGKNLLQRIKYFRGAHHYIAISAAIRDVLTDYGIAAERVHLIRSAVPGVQRIETGRAEILKELSLPNDACLIGDVASLVDHKGHQFLLRAFPEVLSAIPQARLLLAGDGILKETLQAQAASLGIAEKVHFLGQRSDVDRIHSALDLFVMSSHMEGLCTSILDAMSVGAPVVATVAGGIPEIVRDGKTGLLAENRNPKSIAEKIIETHRNPEAARRRAQTARRMVAEEFSVNRMVKETVGLYKELTAHQPVK